MPPVPRPQYHDFEPYQAGKPIEEVARELGLGRIAKLASNESAYGPAPAVIEAIAAEAGGVNRYPDDASFDLVAAIAGFHGLAPEQVLQGAGSTDVIGFSWRVVAGPGDLGVYPWPSFVMYPVYGAYAGSVNVAAPLREGRVDLDRLLSEAQRPEARVVVVCNPNNPTGTYVGHDDVMAFVAQVPEQVLVIIDEAYQEFADAPDFPRTIPHALDHPNVLVTRTFSKVYGLAGLRVGYGLGDPGLVAELAKGRAPFTVSRLAQVAALAALREQDDVASRAKDNAIERDRLLPELAERGFTPLPTQANFVFVTPPDERDWFDLLLRQGVIVRAMPGGLRITFGTRDEDDFLLEAIDQVSRR